MLTIYILQDKIFEFNLLLSFILVPDFERQNSFILSDIQIMNNNFVSLVTEARKRVFQ